MKLLLICAALFAFQASADSQFKAQVKQDYDQYLSKLFDHFHRNPELSLKEYKTAARIAKELRTIGFEVAENVGGTGIVAILKNGQGPMVMMRADMDGLPIKEDSGLPNQSTATQENDQGDIVPVMHACGHDAHITSLVGTGRLMANTKDKWSGTLMLIGQPAEEVGAGARMMMQDDVWELFGKPDFALAMHVNASAASGQLVARPGSVYSGADTVEIIVHGIGAHAASAYRGVDPIVLSAQIIMGIQTVVSRSVPAREASAINVGYIQSGSAANIVPDRAVMKLSVRNDSLKTREILLSGIRRVAENMGRAAGLPEHLLPEVKVSENSVPPQVNDDELTVRLRKVWTQAFGTNIYYQGKRLGMGAEDFPHFVTEPHIRSYYFGVGSTPKALLDAEKSGGKKAPSHHTPGFKVDPEPTILLGVEATVLALHELLQES